MGHRDPRLTLRVYTDVTGMKPRTRVAGLLETTNGHHLGTRTTQTEVGAMRRSLRKSRQMAPALGQREVSGSDGSQTPSRHRIEIRT